MASIICTLLVRHPGVRQSTRRQSDHRPTSRSGDIISPSDVSARVSACDDLGASRAWTAAARKRVSDRWRALADWVASWDCEGFCGEEVAVRGIAEIGVASCIVAGEWFGGFGVGVAWAPGGAILWGQYCLM